MRPGNSDDKTETAEPGMDVRAGAGVGNDDCFSSQPSSGCASASRNDDGFPSEAGFRSHLGSDLSAEFGVVDSRDRPGDRGDRVEGVELLQRGASHRQRKVSTGRVGA